MSDILSQAEIDELLNTLIGGGGAAEDSDSQPSDQQKELQIKAYNFKTANRFPKEQMRTFNIVFQNFIQLFSNQLTGMLRTSCECNLLSVEEISFNEFNNALPSPVVLMVFRAAPMYGQLIMEISPECAYMIINRLLGGSSASSEAAKQFTEIDLALIERIMRQMLITFNEAWDKIINIESEIEKIETNAQFAQIVALNEPIVAITLDLKIGDESGLFSIGIPHTAVEPIAKLLNTRIYYSSSGAIDAERSVVYTEQIKEKLMKTEVSMLAYFRPTPASVIDVVNLQVGDVIRLDHPVSMPLTINVQHIPKFYAKVGSSGHNYAVQIVDIIKEDSENESIARRY